MLVYTGAMLLVPAALLWYRKPIYHYLRGKWYVWRLPRLDLPTYPLLGHAPSLPRDQHRLHATLSAAYMRNAVERGDRVVVLALGSYNFVVLLHPEAVEPLLKSSVEIEKSSIYALLRMWVRDGLSMSTGRKWQHRRKLISPTFHRGDVLDGFTRVMNEHASRFVRVVASSMSEGRFRSGEIGFDLARRLQLLTLDIICETALGERINAQEDENHEYVRAVHQMTSSIHARIANPLLLFDAIFERSVHGKRAREALRVIHAQSRRMIERKMAERRHDGATERKEKRKVFIDMLVDACDQEGRKLTVEDIQEEVDTFQFAGHDTSSVTLTWVIYMLGRHPDIQQKVHDELDSVLAGDDDCDVTSDHLGALRYTEAVVRETLRLFPVAIIMGRRLSRDLEVEGTGHVIPAGEDVHVNTYVMHRHPDFWDSPEEFRPERFVEKSDRHPFAYIPFSAGPRNCVGQRFALREQLVVLAKFFRRFRVVAHERLEDLRLNGSMIFQIDQTLDLTIALRDS